ncbi:hypothetical protein [Nonomuraea sp. NPDC050783]|uniref:hypothetical protein n=1 Tax=Nonomuraea sp. NPDC050783 TaxID=3154634 RepID=UPI00346594BF
MADHDRDAGSRGEEEAPRDPAPTDAYGAPRLKYGELPPKPLDYPTAVYPSSGTAGAGWERTSGPFRDRPRGGSARVAGAGLIGLVLGALLGGTAVAVIGDLSGRHDHRVTYGEYRDGDGPQRGFMGPRGGVRFCLPDDVAPEDGPENGPGNGGTVCVVPAPPEMGLPDTGPTRTG